MGVLSWDSLEAWVKGSVSSWCWVRGGVDFVDLVTIGLIGWLRVEIVKCRPVRRKKIEALSRNSSRFRSSSGPVQGRPSLDASRVDASANHAKTRPATHHSATQGEKPTAPNFWRAANATGPPPCRDRDHDQASKQQLAIPSRIAQPTTHRPRPVEHRQFGHPSPRPSTLASPLGTVPDPRRVAIDFSSPDRDCRLESITDTAEHPP